MTYCTEVCKWQHVAVALISVLFAVKQTWHSYWKPATVDSYWKPATVDASAVYGVEAQ